MPASAVLDSARFPRTAQLAIPRFKSKKYVQPRRWKYISVVAPGAKTYKITARVLNLTKVASYKLIVEPPVEVGVVSEKALNSRASKRIKILAIPTPKTPDIHSKPHPYRISRRALKYKPSKRILRLAIPRE